MSRHSCGRRELPQGWGRLLLGILALLLALVLRLSPDPGAAAFRSAVRHVLLEDGAYRRAVQVLGESAGAGEGNALLVFGQELRRIGRGLGSAVLS